MNKLKVALALSIVGLSACAMPTTQTTTSKVAVEHQANSVTLASHQAGKKTIAITLLGVDESYRIQSVVHRWVASDVFEYRVVLRRKQGEQFVDFTPPLVVSCPQKNGAPVKQAVFTELKQGEVYQAELEAWGNVGGTAAEKRLNSEVKSLATFDFSASNDVEDTLAADLKIVFDKVPFSGTGTVNIQNPAEGAYTNPAAERPSVRATRRIDPNNHTFQDTGVQVASGNHVSIICTGLFDPSNSQPWKVTDAETASHTFPAYDPAPYPTSGKWPLYDADGDVRPASFWNGIEGSPSVYAPAPHMRAFAVVGRIGNGPIFLVGKSKSFTAQESGTLRLMFNDWFFPNNVATTEATIQVK